MHDFAKPLFDRCVRTRIDAACQQGIQLVHDSEIGTAVLGTFKGTDGGGDGAVGIRAGGRKDTVGKGGVIAAAVVGVADQTEIQQFGFFMGEVLIPPVGGQDVFSRGLAVHRIMEVHGFMLVDMTVCLIGIDHHGRQFGYQVNRLSDNVFK